MKGIVLGLALALAASAASAGTKTDMVGHWTSLSCELRPGDQHVKRDITIKADGTWVGSFSFFFDPECKIPTTVFSSSGPWKVAGESPVAPDTLEVDYTLSTGRLRVLSDGAAGYLNGAGKGACGAEVWKAGDEQDVAATGCSPFGLKFPSTEPDLTLVRDGYFFFGARPLDGGTLKARPTALQAPLVKAN